MMLYEQTTPVLGVMMSQGEVLVIVIITAVIVFIAARKRRINRK